MKASLRIFLIIPVLYLIFWLISSDGFQTRIILVLVCSVWWLYYHAIFFLLQAVWSTLIGPDSIFDKLLACYGFCPVHPPPPTTTHINFKSLFLSPLWSDLSM